MSRLWLVILCLILLGTSASLNDAQVDCFSDRLVIGNKGRVTPGDPNNIRAEPARNAEWIGEIPAGREFTVLDGPVCADDLIWWQVRYRGITGWTAEGPRSAYWLEPIRFLAAGVDITNAPLITIETVANLQEIAHITAEPPVDVSALTFSPDGTFLVAGVGGSISIWDVQTGEQVDEYIIPLAAIPAVRSIQVSSDNRFVVWTHTGPQSKIIFILDRSYETIQSLVYDEPIQDFMLLFDYVQVAVAADSLQIITLPTGDVTVTLPLPDFSFASHLALSGNSELLAAGVGEYAGAYPGRVYLWRLQGLISAGFVETDAWTTEESGTYGLSLKALALSPDGSELTTIDGNHMIQRWNTETEEETQLAYEAPGTHIYHMLVSPVDASLALLFDENEPLMLMNLSDGAVHTTITPGVSYSERPRDFYPEIAAFSPDGRLIAVSGSDGQISLLGIPQ